MAGEPTPEAIVPPSTNTPTVELSLTPSGDESDAGSYTVEDLELRRERLVIITEADAQADLDKHFPNHGNKLTKAETVTACELLVDKYRKIANRQAKEALRFHKLLLVLQEENDELKALAVESKTEERRLKRESNRWKVKWATLQEQLDQDQLATTRDVSQDDQQGSAAPSHITNMSYSIRGSTLPPRSFIKIKDPSPFTGKDDYRVGDWIYDMRNKLTQNSSEFDSENLRVAYTARLVSSPARDIIRDRLEPDSLHPIRSTEEIFTVLRQAYGKSKETERQEAKEEYRRLYQKDTPFAMFWADFTRLSSKLGKSPSDQYEDLLERINLDLLKSLGDKKFDNTQELAEWCMESENRLALIRNRQQREEHRSSALPLKKAARERRSMPERREQVASPAILLEQRSPRPTRFIRQDQEKHVTF